MRIDGGSRAALWKSQPLSQDVSQGLLVADGEMAYLTDQEKLVAIRLSDGSAGLGGEVGGRAGGCLPRLSAAGHRTMWL